MRRSVLLIASLSVIGLFTTLSGFVSAQEGTPAGTMDVAQTRAVLDPYLAALVAREDIAPYFADDVVLTLVEIGQEIAGRDAVAGAIDDLHQQTFDARPEVVHLVVSEGSAAGEFVFAGTHTSEFAGIAATGREVRVPYTVFYDLDDGQITALRIYGFASGLMAQLTAEATPTAGMSTGVPRSGTLHLTKECSEYTGEAGAFCTIASSNFDAIPIGSQVVYAEAMTAAGLDSDIVINTPNGDTAYGHVVLDGPTRTGTVTLTGGTGQLANLAADLAVAPLAEPTYSWDGPYSY